LSCSACMRVSQIRDGVAITLHVIAVAQGALHGVERW